ncbi:MAG: ImmA/IrrE family metallo-endopeptidase [Treponema sp.]|nr:ImmA/IrrE family metallo-endopeptidase [Treponema sp.]
MGEPFADFAFACTKANEVLVACTAIQAFPFSVQDVILEMTDMEIRSYGALKKRGICNPAQLFGSPDAVAVESNGRCIMYYDEDMPPVRKQFSFAHELGHIYAGHDIALVTKLLRAKDMRHEALYKKYELEANFFAAQLLMPHQVICELSRRGRKITCAFLMRTFGVSGEAAEKRLKTLRAMRDWNATKINVGMTLDDIVREKFAPFIDATAPRDMPYTEEFEKELALQRERDAWA